MRFISTILLGVTSLILLGCSGDKVDENKKETAFFKDLFADQSSKIWIIDEHIFENELISPEKRNEKMCITFYDDGMFFMQNMYDLAFIGPMNGQYKVKDGSVFLQLSTSNTPQELKIMHASKDSVILEHKKDNFIQMRMKLLPFDRPQKKPTQLERNTDVDISVQ